METDHCDEGQQFAAFLSCSATSLPYYRKLNALHHTPQFYFFLFRFLYGKRERSHKSLRCKIYAKLHAASPWFTHLFYVITGSLHVIAGQDI